MKLKALSAADVVHRLIKLAENHWPGQPVMLNASTAVPNLGFQTEGSTGKALASQAQVLEFLNAVGTRPHVVANRAQLKLQENHNRGFSYTCGDELIADLTIEGTKTATEAASWLAAADAEFDFASFVDLVGTHAANEHEKNALHVRERATAELHVATAKLGEYLAQIAQDDAKQRRELNAKLEADHREKVDADNAAHQGRMQELEERRRVDQEQLTGERQTFEAEKAAFETGEAKYVRRRMLTKLEEVLAKSESMKLSKETQNKRDILHAFVWILLAAAALIAWAMGFQYWTTRDLHYGVPMGTATVTFFATLVYYLRWNDRWFREHSEAEFAAKRYQADVVRANWLAELFAEQKQAGAELPPELLEAFTRNLFQGSTSLAEAEHPFEQLTSLVKRAKEIRIGKGELSLRAGKRKESKSGGE